MEAFLDDIKGGEINEVATIVKDLPNTELKFSFVMDPKVFEYFKKRHQS